MKKYSIKINKKVHQVEADGNMPLLWVLRDILGMEGTKYGCGVGSCGACTVHLNGDAVRSCQLPISSLAGMEITTIEGLSAKGDHPVQKAWVDVDVAQCGYCQSGQIMSAAALLKSTPNPTEEDIENFMTGNISQIS
ncbi:MAG: (2Fe-2S)-binding protein [Aquirufa sp.]